MRLLKRFTVSLVGCSPLIVTLSGFVGMVIYQLVVYGSVIIVILLVGGLYSILGEGFGHGIKVLSSLKVSAIPEETGLNPISIYGVYLGIISAIGAFVGGRVAGWMSANREYWSAIATVLVIYSVAYIFDYSDVGAPTWYSYGMIVGCILAAMCGAHRARRMNKKGKRRFRV